MSAEQKNWTPEPWNAPGRVVRASDCFNFVQITVEDYKRACVCVDFCADFSNEALAQTSLAKLAIDAAKVSPLLAALELARPFVERFYDYQHPSENGSTLRAVDEAIAGAQK